MNPSTPEGTDTTRTMSVSCTSTDFDFTTTSPRVTISPVGTEGSRRGKGPRHLPYSPSPSLRPFTVPRTSGLSVRPPSPFLFYGRTPTTFLWSRISSRTLTHSLRRQALTGPVRDPVGRAYPRPRDWMDRGCRPDGGQR